MDDVLSRMWIDLMGRIDGPMSFRLVLQPVMAIVFAFRDGRADARAGRPLYLRALFGSADERRVALASGWRAIGRVIVLAILMDLVYQWRVFHRIYPVELFNVVILLAVIPYVIWRGVSHRLMRRRARP
jgi:hypothetical protein